MRRLPDWRPRLHRYLREVACLPFVAGHHDCCLFAAGAVEAQTGIDFAEGWRGYATLAEGMMRLRRAGYVDHVGLIAEHLPEVHPVEACEGDISIAQTDHGPATGVVQGPAIYVLTPVAGMGFMPLSAATRLFKVG